MGILDGLGKIIKGKPVFEVPAQSKTATDGSTNTVGRSADSSQRFVDKRGYKIIPEIELRNTKSRIDDQFMTTTAWVTNISAEDIRLDHVIVLEKKRSILRELKPGQGYEIKLYEGPAAINEYNSRAELVFRRIENDDVFSITYFVEFNREADGQFTVEDLHKEGPTRDI